MNDFDEFMSDINEKVEFHTSQYNVDIPKNEEHSHTSGGTYFGDSSSSDIVNTDTKSIVSVDEKIEPLSEEQVSGFDYFILFGLIIMVVVLIISKIRGVKK